MNAFGGYLLQTYKLKWVQILHIIESFLFMIIPETLEDSPVKKEEFKAYPWRWLVLFAFCTFTYKSM